MVLRLRPVKYKNQNKYFLFKITDLIELLINIIIKFSLFS